MSFDLNMQFKVDSTELQTKGVAQLDAISKAIDALSKAQDQSTKAGDAATKSSILASKAKEAEAKAAKAAAEATLAQTKATTAQDKAAQASSNSQAKVAASTRANMTVLDRQTSILEFMVQGFSRGQATQLTYAKAAGQTAEEIQKLSEVLLTQRKLIGGEPFDKSISGLTTLKNQYIELKEAIDQYNAGSGLSAKQARELARDKQRTIERLKAEGASVEAVEQELKRYNDEYVTQARVVNDLLSVEKQKLQSDKDRANASRAVQREEERMKNILDQLNSETNQNANFSEKAAIAQANYARNLRLAGVSAEEAKKRLAEYSVIQQRIRAEDEKRQVQYLQRGLQPQIGDVVVSLASGQNPLTVLLQQGDQIRGLITQTQVKGKELEQAMRDAIKGTVTSIVELSNAMAQLAIGPFKQLGTAATDFGAKLFLGKKSLEQFRNEMIAANGLASTYTTEIRALSFALKAIPIALGAAAGAAAVFGLALAAAYVGVSKETDNLSKSLIRTGGSLGFTKDSAIAFANGLEGITTSKAVEFMTAFAKEGGFTRDQLMTILPVAEEMRVVFGDSVEDIVKSFAKFKDDPVKALYELATRTGEVSLETIRLAEEQVKLGDILGATTTAMNEAARVNAKATEDMRRDYSTLGIILVETKRFFSDFWGTVKGLIYQDTATEKLYKDLGKLNERIVGTQSNLSSGLGRLLGIKYDDSNLKKLLAQRDAIVDGIRANALAAKSADEARIANARQAEAARKTADAYKSIETPLEKYNRTVNEIGQRMLAANGDMVAIAQNQALLRKAEKDYADALEKKNKVSKEDRAELKQRQKDEEIYGNLVAKSSDFTNTYAEELQALNRHAKVARLTQEEYNVAFNALLSKQPYFIAQEKDKAKVMEISNRLLGRADDLGKEYYSTLADLNDLNAKGYFKDSPGMFERLKAALEATTPAARKLSAAWKESQEKSLELQRALDDEYANLMKEAEVIGLNDKERKKALKTKELELKLNKELSDVDNLRIKTKNSDPEAIEKKRLEAYERYAAGVRNLNQEIANDFAKEMQEANIKIQEGLADAIATALFEGGKAGRTKLRDLIVAELRKPITVVIQAAVQQIFGGVFNANPSSGGISSGQNVFSGFGLSTDSEFKIYDSLNSFAKVLTDTGIPGLKDFGETLFSNSRGISESIGTLSKNIGPIISYGSAILDLTKGKFGSAAGTAIGTYFFGPIGGAIGGGIGKAIDNFFGGKGGPKTESGFGSGILGVSGDAFSLSNQKFAKDISTNISGAYKTIAESLNLATKDLEVAVFTSVDSAGKALTQLQVIARQNGIDISNRSDRLGGSENVGRSPEELEAAIAEETNKILLAALLASDLPQKYKDIIQNATNFEEGITIVQTMQALDAAIKQLDDTFRNMQGTSVEAALALIEAFGGVENFQASLNSFYENFYSEAEKQANSLKQVKDAFASVGLVMPDITKGSAAAREEFRKLVESQDINTEAGRKAYAVLLQLSSSFAELTPVLEQTSTAIKDTIDLTAQQIAQQKETLAGKLADLDTELFLLQNAGNITAIRNREMQAISSSNRELQIAIYARQDEITAIKAAQAASEAAAQERLRLIQAAADEALRAEQARLTEEKNLYKQLLQAQGNTADLRRLELAELDPSNRALQLRIWALQDEAEAIAEAKAEQMLMIETYAQVANAANAARQAAAQEASAKQEAILQERSGLENAYLQAVGDTATLRARELLGLDASNRELQIRIWAIQDEKDAQAAAAQVTQDVTSAQDNYNNSILEATDILTKASETIAQYFANLRSSASGFNTPAVQSKIAQAEFERQYELAKSGDRDALSGITGSADNYIKAFTNSATTSDQVQRLIQQLQLRLTDLPKQIKPEDLIVDAIRQATTTTVTNYNTVSAAQNKTLEDRIRELNSEIQVKLIADAKSTIEKLIKYVANTDDLPADLKELALATYLPELQRQISLIQAANISQETKILALKANDLLTRTFELVAGSSLTPDMKSLALKSNDNLVRTLNAVLGTSDAQAIRLANSTSEIINKTLTASMGAYDSVALSLALKQSDILQRQVQAAMGSSDANALRIALANNDTLTRSIVTNLGTGSTVAQQLILATSDSITRTISAALGTGNQEALSLALAANSVISKTITAALGSNNPEALALALKNSETITKTINAVISNNALTPEQKNLVALLSGATVDTLAINAAINLAADGNFSATLAASVALAISDSFSKLDTSVNGLLDKNELVAALGPLATAQNMAAIYALLDTDGDASISRLEAIKASSSSTAFETRATSIGVQGLQTTANTVASNTLLNAGRTLMVSDDVKSLFFNTLTFDAADGLRSVFDATKLAAEASASIWNRITNGQLGAYVTLARVQSADAARDIGTNFAQAFANWGGAGMKVENANFGTIKDNTANTASHAYTSAVQGIGANQRLDVLNNVQASMHTLINNMNNLETATRDYLANFFNGHPLRVYSQNRVTAPGFSVFAKGGVFTNGIVDKPTMFNYGQMGEAGPEAIIPLSKGSDGSLGVTMRMPMTDNSSYYENMALREELRSLRQEMKAALYAIAKNTGKTSDQLRSWDDGGRMSVGIVQETNETIKVTP